jgi:hypothetical protein
MAVILVIGKNFVMFSNSDASVRISDRAFGSGVVRFVYVMVVLGTQRTLLSPCALTLHHNKGLRDHDL